MTQLSLGHPLQRSHAFQSRRTATGFTLLELLVTLTLFTTLVASTIGLTTIVKRSVRQGDRSFQRRQDIRRFAEDVRRELRNGGEVQIKDNDVVITNQSQSTRTSYEIRSNTAIARVVSDSNSSEDSNGDLFTKETYEVGIDAQVDVKWLEEDRLIQWTITETSRKTRPIIIVSALGSDPQ